MLYVTYLTKSCPQAADFLAATAATHALSTSFPIYQVHGVSDRDVIEPDSPNRSKYILTGVILTVLVGLLLGVLVQAQKKRANGITWFPEGFLRNNRSVEKKYVNGFISLTEDMV